MTKLATRSAMAGNSVVGTYEIAPWALHATSKTGKGRRNNGYKEREACGRGHKYVEGSWSYQKKDGYDIRRCLVCQRARVEEQKSDPEWANRRREAGRIQAIVAREAKKLGITTAEYRKLMGNNIGKKDPLASFMVTGPEAVAQDRVNQAVDDRGRPKCESNPDAYFSDSDTELSTQDAKKMCAGCPVVVECLERMKFSVPTTGSMVAGGRLFVNGKLVPLNMV